MVRAPALAQSTWVGLYIESCVFFAAGTYFDDVTVE